MLMVFVRALVMYIVVMITMRLMGKRMIGQLQPFELAVSMLMADLAAAPLSDIGIPLLYGIIPMLSLLFIHSIIAILSCKFPAIRRLVSGKPNVVINDGIIDYKQLVKQCYSVNDLMEALRVTGQLDISQVGSAILETNGQLSAFPDPKHRPTTLKDMHIQPQREGVPLVLAIDGKPDNENLTLLKKNSAWLRDELSGFNLPLENTLVCTLDRQGAIYAQSYDGGIFKKPALPKEKADV